MEHPSTVAPSGLEVPTSMKSIISNMKITIINIDQEEMEIVFDIIGVEAPLVNALRRILISEVPTIAIEKVTLHQNTSVIPDEVLCHRLGLIPIKVDPRLFQFRASILYMYIYIYIYRRGGIQFRELCKIYIKSEMLS